MAAQNGVPFVDVAAAKGTVGPTVPDEDRYRWSLAPLPRIADAVAMRLAPPSKDLLGRRRHLVTTVDGIHWSSASARAVAAAVDTAL